MAVWRNALQPDPPAIDPTAFEWSLEEGSKTLIPTTLPSDTPLAPDDLLKLGYVLAVVKPHARHIDAVTTVQTLPAQCPVPVRVAKVVSTKEQGKLFGQTTMTKLNICISTEPGMGSKQLWKLFNMVTMTTINLKLIHHCY